MTQFTDGVARSRKQRTDQAIALAMQSRWDDAARANRAIIELFPDDVDSYNRLGKALTELGRYAEARDAYARALQIDPNNAIARKNLPRLDQLAKAQPAARVDKVDRVDPRLFIEETGKTGFTLLHHLAPRDVLAKMTAGDQVYLKPHGRGMRVENASGESLGEVEPKLALRLVNLMKGGNRYAAAITAIESDQVRLILKEVYQHPSQAGRVSFPAKPTEVFRPYTRESLLRYELEEEEEGLEEEAGAEWEADSEPAVEEGEIYEEEPAPLSKPEEFEAWHNKP
ncbi:MAG: tetratricopeptide repeat protein [Chloroflexi bacterium]|nr:tetratricopeptide repeat protein [Chloroflexota bacterium]